MPDTRTAAEERWNEPTSEEVPDRVTTSAIIRELRQLRQEVGTLAIAVARQADVLERLAEKLTPAAERKGRGR